MRNVVFCLFVVFSLAGCQSKQQEQTEELVYTTNDKDWYAREKGITKYLIQLMEGNPELAIEQANKQGKDAEACFVKALAYAKLENADSAMFYVRKSLDWGLTIDRYQGLHELLVDLNTLPEFSSFITKKGKQLVHGPLLGATTSTTAKFWLRTASLSEVQIIVSETNDFKSEMVSEVIKTVASTEFVAKPMVEKLKASTKYFYRIKVDGKIDSKIFTFTTQPIEGDPAEVTIAFGGGAAYIPWHSYMWNTLKSHTLNAMLLMGDNVYIDYPTYPEIQRYCYYRRQSKPEYRDFSSGTPIFSIWDDHDFGNNDSFGGKEIDKPAWKRPVFELYRNQFANPFYGGGDKNPGVWYNFQLADVDFFMLDCRYYREASSKNGNDHDPQMLGPVQLEWLKEELLKSQGSFKVIVSSVPWAYGAKEGMEGRYDTWRGYKKERKEIFDFLAENKIEGVVLLSADRHRSDLWKIKRENGYPLYEMESSKLINTHTHNCMNDPERILCYNEKCSFGKIIFNTKLNNPQLTYQIWNIDNELEEEYTIKLSELKH